MATQNEEIKRIIKAALVVVNKLADIELDDMNEDKIIELIKHAKQLKKNHLWKL